MYFYLHGGRHSKQPLKKTLPSCTINISNVCIWHCDTCPFLSIMRGYAWWDMSLTSGMDVPWSVASQISYCKYWSYSVVQDWPKKHFGAAKGPKRGCCMGGCWCVHIYFKTEDGTGLLWKKASVPDIITSISVLLCFFRLQSLLFRPSSPYLDILYLVFLNSSPRYYPSSPSFSPHHNAILLKYVVNLHWSGLKLINANTLNKCQVFCEQRWPHKKKQKKNTAVCFLFIPVINNAVNNDSSENYHFNIFQNDFART